MSLERNQTSDNFLGIFVYSSAPTDDFQPSLLLKQLSSSVFFVIDSPVAQAVCHPVLLVSASSIVATVEELIRSDADLQ